MRRKTPQANTGIAMRWFRAVLLSILFSKVGEVNQSMVYASNVVEGFAASQRRSCKYFSVPLGNISPNHIYR